jgi:hypothetical protein
MLLLVIDLTQYETRQLPPARFTAGRFYFRAEIILCAATEVSDFDQTPGDSRAQAPLVKGGGGKHREPPLCQKPVSSASSPTRPCAGPQKRQQKKRDGRSCSLRAPGRKQQP